VTTWGPGFEIAGRYRLTELLGRGGMGEVWRAEHLALHSQVAIKLIEPRSATNEAVVRRFMQEARAAAALESPHVVRTTDFGVIDGTPYIVMELLQGESLAQRLERMRRLSPAETERVIRHVARAVSKAHEAGFVHRDLKPDNVFIVVNDDEELVKVLDFGIAKAMGGSFGEQATKTRTGALMGTPYYMSPEQAQGDRSVDYRSDLWSMAIIAFECLTGTRPFDSEGLGALVMQICAGPIPIPSQVAPVPPGFDEWFARATSRDPAGRFQSARELSGTLRHVLAPSVDTEFTGTSRVVWPIPGPQTHSSTASSVSAATPMPAALGASTASQVTPGALALTAGKPPQGRGAAGIVIVLALMGVVGLAVAGFVIHRVVRGGSEAAARGPDPAVSVSLPGAHDDPSTEAPSPSVAAPASSTTAGTSSTKSGTPVPTAKNPAKPTPSTTATSKGRLGF